MKDDPIGCGKKREAASRTVKIQIIGKDVCQNEPLRWAASIGIFEFYLLPFVLLRVEYPEVIHISCYEMFTSILWTGSETLTHDTRIVKSTKEDDVVFPQRHSRFSLFEKGGYENGGKGGSNLCPERADGRTLVSIRSHDRVAISKHQKSR